MDKEHRPFSICGEELCTNLNYSLFILTAVSLLRHDYPAIPSQDYNSHKYLSTAFNSSIQASFNPKTVVGNKDNPCAKCFIIYKNFILICKPINNWVFLLLVHFFILDKLILPFLKKYIINYLQIVHWESITVWLCSSHKLQAHPLPWKFSQWEQMFHLVLEQSFNTEMKSPEERVTVFLSKGRQRSTNSKLMQSHLRLKERVWK